MKVRGEGERPKFGESILWGIIKFLGDVKNIWESIYKNPYVGEFLNFKVRVTRGTLTFLGGVFKIGGSMYCPNDNNYYKCQRLFFGFSFYKSMWTYFP